MRALVVGLIAATLCCDSLGRGSLGCGSSVTVQNGQGGGSSTTGGGGTATGVGGSGAAGACDGVVPPALDIGGRHFLLANLETPIQTQLQLFAVIDTSEAPGAVVELVNADRDDSAGCPMPCNAAEVCSSVQQQCVPPSQSAESLAEHVDFIPNPTPPTGYEAVARACVEVDMDDGALLVTEPFTIEVPSPPVTVQDIVLRLRYQQEPDGLVEASGTITTGEVLLGTTPSGSGEGQLFGRLLNEP